MFLGLVGASCEDLCAFKFKIPEPVCCAFLGKLDKMKEGTMHILACVHSLQSDGNHSNFVLNSPVNETYCTFLMHKSD